LAKSVSDGVNNFSIGALNSTTKLLEIVGLKRNKVVVKRKFNFSDIG